MVDSDQRLCHGAVLMAGSCIGTLLTLLALAASHPTAAQTQSAIAPSLAQVAQDVESADAGVRRRALRALRDLGGPETLTLLARLADDEEHGIRKDAIETITRIYVEPPAGTRPGNVEDVFQVGPYHVIPWPPSAELTRALTRALADDYPDVRRDAAYAMAIVSPRPASERAAFELIASLSDRDPAVRIAAARALGRLGIKAAGVPLVGRVNDEVLEVRLAAMRALGDVRETRAVPALTDQFEFYVRGVAGRAAIDALARIADDASVPLFESQSGSGYPAHRRAAYEGLARTRAAKVSASRIDGARGSEDDRRVRLAMAYAVASAGSPLTPIVEALADSDLAAQALEYLVELGPARTADLAALLRDQNPLVRRNVATALGFTGGSQAESALAAARQDPDDTVRHAIEIAQLRIRNAKP
jgi:HEAT repeat protein